MNDRVIEQYQHDENIMIQLYVQWCMNHDVDAILLYEKAYPQQPKNVVLEQVLEETEKDALQVDTETVLHVLQLFGNEDLAFEVSQKALHIK